MEESNLIKELSATLNRACAENGSNTPDFILATYLTDCLNSFDKAVSERDRWYGKELSPINTTEIPPSVDKDN